MEMNDRIRTRHQAIWPHLDEKGRRLWAASEAQAHGRGGLKLVHEITGMSRSVIAAGMNELSGISPPDRRSDSPARSREKTAQGNG